MVGRRKNTEASVKGLISITVSVDIFSTNFSSFFFFNPGVVIHVI